MLTAEQIEAFHSNGFLTIDQLIDDDTLATLRTRYDQVLSREIDCGTDDRLLGDITRQVMGVNKYHEFFADNPALRAGRAMAEDIAGEPCRFLFDMLIVKPPGANVDTPWHQDRAYSSMPFAPAGTPTPVTMMTFWVALDDVDETTGCMWFLPGGHSKGLREHYVASGDPASENRMLATKDVDPAAAVACPLQAGGCTIHFDGTLHYTAGNRSSDRTRRAYIFNYKPESMWVW